MPQRHVSMALPTRGQTLPGKKRCKSPSRPRFSSGDLHLDGAGTHRNFNQLPGKTK